MIILNVYLSKIHLNGQTYSGILTTGISNHFPVFHISQKSCEYPTNNEYKTIRVINEIKPLKFMEKSKTLIGQL